MKIKSECSGFKSAILTMPWGMKCYRWKGTIGGNFPKVVEFWNEDNKWETCKNINVHTQISKRKI